MEHLLYRYTPNGEEGDIRSLENLLENTRERKLKVIVEYDDGTYASADALWNTRFSFPRDMSTETIAGSYDFFEASIVDGDLVVNAEYGRGAGHRLCGATRAERFRFFQEYPCELDDTTEDSYQQSCQRAFNSPNKVPLPV